VYLLPSYKSLLNLSMYQCIQLCCIAETDAMEHVSKSVEYFQKLIILFSVLSLTKQCFQDQGLVSPRTGLTLRTT